MYIFIYFTHIFQRFLILHNECRLSLGELCSSLFLCIIKMPQRNRRVNVGNGVSILVSIPVSYSQMRIGKLMQIFFGILSFQEIGSWVKAGVSFQVYNSY